MIEVSGKVGEGPRTSVEGVARARRLRFFKLDGAGNDFVGLDWRAEPAMTDAEFGAMARALCDRHHGVGADGMLVIQPGDDAADFRMRYFNSDGSVGEMCGNGARCIVAMAQHIGAAPAKCRFHTDAGLYEAERDGDGIVLTMPDVPHRVRRVSLEGPAQAGREVEFVVVGNPHAVIFSDDLGMENVEQTGREIRRDPAFRNGTNANFVQWDGNALHVRTYERGVEAETLACGTGSVASVCALYERERWKGEHEITVLPTSGIKLKVRLQHSASGYDKIQLGGPANIVFGGECEIDSKGKIGL